MIFSHMLSDAVLAVMAIGIYWQYFQHLFITNRLLWGFFLLTIGLSALLGIGHFAGMQALDPLYASMQQLAGSLGVVGAVVGTWTLLRNQTISNAGFAGWVLLGLILFACLYVPEIKVFAPIIPAFGILIIMLLGVLALLQRNKRGLWIVLAAMAMGLATKFNLLERLIHPIDFYHYMLAVGCYLFGQAVRPRPIR